MTHPWKLLGAAGFLIVFELYGIQQIRKPLPPLPETALDPLCAELLQSVKTKGGGTVAREIESVTGPTRDPALESLKPFLNTRLSKGFPRFLFSDEVRAKTLSETSRWMRKGPWAGASPNMTPVAPDVLLFAEWGPLTDTEIQLTLRAVRLGIGGEGVETSLRLPHPSRREKEQQEQKRWLLALHAGAALLIFLALFFFRSLSENGSCQR